MAGRLAVVIIAFNEETEVGDCVRAAKQAGPDEVVVIDSLSTDGTRRVAEEAGARVVEQRWLGYSAQRNLAEQLTDCEWILFLDADERVTVELAAEIRRLVSGPPATGAAAASVPRENWFLGRPLRCKDPDRQVRLARRGTFRWEGAIHERMRVTGEIVRLGSPLLHRPWDDLDEMMRKKQGQARIAAAAAAEKGERFRWWMLARSVMSLPKNLLLRRGLFEGRHAVVYSLAYCVYSLQKAIYLLETDVRRTTEPLPFPDPLRPAR